MYSPKPISQTPLQLGGAMWLSSGEWKVGRSDVYHVQAWPVRALSSRFAQPLSSFYWSYARDPAGHYEGRGHGGAMGQKQLRSPNNWNHLPGSDSRVRCHWKEKHIVTCVVLNHSGFGSIKYFFPYLIEALITSDISDFQPVRHRV